MHSAQGSQRMRFTAETYWFKTQNHATPSVFRSGERGQMGQTLPTEGLQRTAAGRDTERTGNWGEVTSVEKV